MPEWLVDNWDTLAQVSSQENNMVAFSTWSFFFIQKLMSCYNLVLTYLQVQLPIPMHTMARAVVQFCWTIWHALEWRML